MDAIVVVGGGGHARVVIGILRKIQRFRVAGYTDFIDKGLLAGVPYLGCDCKLTDLSKQGELLAVLGIGQVGLGAARYQLWSRLQSPTTTFPHIVSPDAVLNEGTALDEAAIVMDGAVVNTGAVIGRGVIVNTNSTVEHDVVLSDWVHVAPGATIAGGVTVGAFSLIGAGATVIEGLTIAANCIVGAGATVINDLTEAGTYVGTPARRLNQRS